MATCCLVTTYGRPESLARSLPQIATLGAPVLVVDDGSKAKWTQELIDCAIADYLYVPNNRGLAAAMNIGLSYLLADKSIEWISYFQDDVDVHPKCLEVLEKFHDQAKLLTGHDAGEHPSFDAGKLNGVDYCKKWSIRATHMHAHRSFWQSVYPIPTRELGAPKRTGEGRGLGSNADWWIVRDAPNSCQKTKQPIICVPGLVRSFLWEAKDSCWNNTQRSGEEPPLREFC